MGQVDSEEETCVNDAFNMPDVVGATLGEARRLLDEVGAEILHIEITAPPKRKLASFDDSFRVIRVKAVGRMGVELLICDAYRNC